MPWKWKTFKFPQVVFHNSSNLSNPSQSKTKFNTLQGIQSEELSSVNNNTEDKAGDATSRVKHSYHFDDVILLWRKLEVTQAKLRNSGMTTFTIVIVQIKYFPEGYTYLHFLAHIPKEWGVTVMLVA